MRRKIHWFLAHELEIRAASTQRFFKCPLLGDVKRIYPHSFNYVTHQASFRPH